MRIRHAAAGIVIAISSLVGHSGMARGEAESVAFEADYPQGAVVIVNKERKLYLVAGGGKAQRFPVAIGVPDEQWTGKEIVTNKRENPDWIEPDDDGEGDRIKGGDPKNPLGVRALYLGRTLWRIHGTIWPWSIGKAASNGCIRMLNDDVTELYQKVEIGTPVYVVQTLSQSRPEHAGRKLDD
jgi:lipoprotein-anchoring transpeptidase ErfK/SrfK